MKRLFRRNLFATTIASLALLGLAGANAGAEPITVIRTTTVTSVKPHRLYWWPAHVDCVVSDGQRRDGSLNATPYIVCKGYPDQFKRTPPPSTILNKADNVYATPDYSAGTQPCDYEDVPCS